MKDSYLGHYRDQRGNSCALILAEDSLKSLGAYRKEDRRANYQDVAWTDPFRGFCDGDYPIFVSQVAFDSIVDCAIFEGMKLDGILIPIRMAL